jgi:hypothetical protein
MSVPNVDFENVIWSAGRNGKKLVASRRVQPEPVNDDNVDKPKLTRSNAIDFTPFIICNASARVSTSEQISKKRTLEDVISPCNKSSPGHELCCNMCFDLKFKNYDELTQTLSEMNL